MTKVDIISGFLGAGKTTFIKKLIEEVFAGEQLVLIENEFGEIGIDGGFLKDAGVEITEMNSGCICCTLVGDFSKALKEVLEKYHPDRIIIEPSGVGKLSDVAKAIEGMKVDNDIVIDGKLTVVDGKKAKLYMQNFGEFYNNQVEYASTIIVSRTQMMNDKQIEECVHLLREKNEHAPIISTPWDELGKEAIMRAFNQETDIEEILVHDHDHHHDHDDECGCGCHDHHHHHHDHGEECTCGCHDHDHEHHHDHDEECTCGCHDHDHEHHHDHDEECTCGCHDHDHEHHHDHDEECTCGCHDHDHEHHHDHDEECGCGCHDHHHHHHADEVFTSWGKETAHKYKEEELDYILKALSETEGYGIILRAKGIIQMEDGSWKQFDMVPGEYETRQGQPDYTGRICVIGTNLNEEELKKVFHI